MKKKITLWAAIVAAALLFSTETIAASAGEMRTVPDEEIRTVNNIDCGKWRADTGNAAEAADGEGILLSGRGSSPAFAYTYLNSVPLSNIMLDFRVDTAEAEGSKLTFAFFGNEEVCSFVIEFSAAGFDAFFSTAGGTFSYENMKYKEDGHIQLRLAKDDITDYETGNIVSDWNVVFGIQKSSATLKNDAYSVRMNRFDGADFAPLADALDAYEGAEAVEMRVSMESAAEKEASLKIIQVSTDCFYDYYVVPASYIRLIKCNYTEIGFSFSRPEGEAYQGAGFIVERLRDGKPDCVYIFTNAYADSLTDIRLKQNTKYTYVITALRSVSVSNRVACNRIVYKYEDYEVTTKKGNPVYLAIGVTALVAAAALGVLGYVFYFDIKDKWKRK